MQTLFVEFGFAFFSGSGPPFCFDVKLLLLFEKVALIRPVIQIRIGISTLAQRMGGDNVETLDSCCHLYRKPLPGPSAVAGGCG